MVEHNAARETAADWARLIDQARAGSASSLGELFEQCRAYLLAVARQEMDSLLRVKTGASDLVQETFVDAQAAIGRFVGDSPEELLAWMRRILLNNLADRARSYRQTRKRHLTREIPLATGGSRPGLTAALVDHHPTPRSAALIQEAHTALGAALATLPAGYQEVIRLRHHRGLSFAEIGAALGRTENAARKLWVRAIEQLQAEFEQRHGPQND
ncbi:MAG: sigma-70 family RNA polymerase sigma factor [Pirellulales bacterium]|nr:sigma-70 family RNA polymerase sigma factor [Pirellulales bacterium]